MDLTSTFRSPKICELTLNRRLSPKWGGRAPLASPLSSSSSITTAHCRLLALIYTRSGSLFFVVALHSLYDGIWFFGPYLAAPLPDIWRPAFLLAALALVSLWAWRCDRGPLQTRLS